MAAPPPTRRSVSDIKSNLLRPATTSHFDVFITEPPGSKGYDWEQFKKDNNLSGYDKNFLHLCCSETVLPGSSLATTEINNDYTGVTERHAYRRLFDDRIDLTFYVMISPSRSDRSVNTYLPIRLFESWIKYIAAEQISREGNNVKSPNYSYRMRYPNEYYGELAIIKYERDYKSSLKYTFVNAYPISVASMPVSYDASNLLQCTVSFSYIRYYIDGLGGSGEQDQTTSTASNQALSPIEQAKFNASNLTLPGLEGAGALSTGQEETAGSTYDRMPGGSVYEANRQKEGLIRLGASPAEAERLSRESL